MSPGARYVITAFIGAALGFLLATVQNAWDLSYWQVLVLGDVIVAVYVMICLPWVMTGMGWIGLWRNREQIRETGQIK